MRIHLLLLLALALFTGSQTSAVGATGFWDPGIQHGGWRTDYASPLIGTTAHPLSYISPCLFPGTIFAICPDNFEPIPGIEEPQPVRSFSRSNWVDRSNSTPADRFWVATANIEPALSVHCNSGPPNQSEAILGPFEGIFGIRVDSAAAIGRPWQREATLAVDLSHRPRQLAERPLCRPGDFIPYLGFGIYSERGGGDQPLAILRDGADAPVLRFNYRLVDSNAEFFAAGDPVPPRPRGQYSGIMVEAQWGGRKHAIWVDLLNAYVTPRPTTLAQWNWSVLESFYYPGAEIVFTSAPTLLAECGESGFALSSMAPATYALRQPIPMRIDLRRLYECLGHYFSSPFPTSGTVPLTGMQFFVEVGIREHDGEPGLAEDDYDSRLGIAVSAVDIVPASGSPISSDTAFVAQFGRDLLGHAWSDSERDHWLQRIAENGRAETVAEMLRSREVRRTAIAAATLHLIAFGYHLDRGAFDATLEDLREGHAIPFAAAALASEPAFIRATGTLDDEAFVRRMYRRALGGELDTQADSEQIGESFGSIEYWVHRLGNGSADRADVLLSVFRLAMARGLLDTEADIVTLYYSFAGLLPDSGGIGGWRNASDMPARLAETLYYTSLYRNRFAD